MSNHGRLALLLAAISTLAPSTSDATTGNAIKPDYWKALCKLGRDGAKIANIGLKSIKQPALAAQTDLQAMLRAQVFAEANNTETGTQASRTTLVFLATELTRNLAYYTGPQVNEDVTRARDGGRLEGAINEFIATHANGAFATKGCLSQKGSDTDVITGFTAAKAAEPACEVQWTQATPENTETDILDTSSLKAPFNDAVAHGAFAAGGDTKCDINSDHTNFKLNDGNTGGSVSGHVPSFAAGLIDLETSNGLHVTDLKAAVAGGKKPYLKAAIEAKAAGVRQITAGSTKAPITALNDENFKQAARIAILKKKPTATEGDQPLNQAIQAAYGGEANSNKPVTSDINAMNIEGILPDKPGIKTLGQVSDVTDLLRLYFYYSDLKKQKLLTAEKKLQELETKTSTKSAAEKEKECNTKGKDKQDECEKLKEKGCVFNKDGNDGEKCTLSEEGKKEAEKAAKQETGGKDSKTNTTGSNSFVINKAPLLLAFLLF
uniref:Variant surface glycoprotein 1125.305 n=1 Tax=Trypanosoma brucei TaxID=5691 RepID=M4SYB4_9TRYP|nr:variant surface glycoprotein 536 [Trypanosoma brucei]APD73128.1 variant surface glycoprotein 1125.305 [Trypanosoma brucei]